jgi:hypothetical protein
VQANAKLVLISGVVGFVVAVPGLGLLQIGAPLVLLAAAAMFAVGAVAATQLPTERVVPDASGSTAATHLRGAGILLAATAMAVLRGVVGFLAFLLAFELREAGDPSWFFGVVLGASAVGALAGAAMAPRLRRAVREERILFGALVAVVIAGGLALQLDRRVSTVLIAFVVGAAAGGGRLAFDAIVQRDAPEGDQGRSFARFETRFQMAWVVGALIPVALSLPLTAGYVGIILLTGLAAISYFTGRELTGGLRRGVGVDRVQARVRARIAGRPGPGRHRLGRRPR